ncbi:MAG: hypothetical protein Q7K42_03520 [Candidatus Diapherotrites archaeon]|nr:hypothetical protein [Candidatus Diapherotrites archaeon]
MRLQILAILCLFLFSGVFAETSQFILKDSVSGEKIQNKLAMIEINGEKSIKFIKELGVLQIELPEENSVLKILVDSPDTNGKDYYLKTTVSKTNSEQELLLFPASSIKGSVKDKFDNVVSNADLDFDCQELIEFDFPTKTNNFGAFSIDAFPLGECKISATFGEGIGFQKVSLAQGELKEVEIKLDKSILPAKKEDDFLQLAGLGAILLVLIAGIFFFFSQKKTTKPENIKITLKKTETVLEKTEAKTESTLTKRAQEVLPTLNEKEQEIVKFLFANNHSVMQAKIIFGIGIPKTTLSRILYNLEQKNLITIEKLGKTKKIALTKWILEK